MRGERAKYGDCKEVLAQSPTLINCKWLVKHKSEGQRGPTEALRNEYNDLLALSVLFVPYICSLSLNASVQQAGLFK